MISRFKSTLSLYSKTHPLHAKVRPFRAKVRPLRAKARHFASDRGRVYMVAGAAVVVAGVSTAGAVIGPAPTAEKAAQLATIPYTGAGAPLGHAEDSMFHTALGSPSAGHGSASVSSAAHASVPVSPTGDASAPTFSAGHASTHGSISGPTVSQNQGQGRQDQAGSGQSAPQAVPNQPYLLYDSVSPFAIPAGQRIATYVDGPFAVSPAQVAGRPSVLWIDTNGSNPIAAGALDVEPGDATPAGAAQWVAQKLSAHPDSTAVIYTMRSEWPQVQSDISMLPSQMQSHVRYWIADPTGFPHMVPGASATQWYWGSSYDISTVTGF